MDLFSNVLGAGLQVTEISKDNWNKRYFTKNKFYIKIFFIKAKTEILSEAKSKTLFKFTNYQIIYVHFNKNGDSKRLFRCVSNYLKPLFYFYPSGNEQESIRFFCWFQCTVSIIIEHWLKMG